jgi:hypothetical protein
MMKAELDKVILKKRSSRGQSIPKYFPRVVQSALNAYTSQSVVFHRMGRDRASDLFFSPEGKFSGTWAVHRGRALAFLAA